jgi:nicotinate phosphoribosyltransferase
MNTSADAPYLDCAYKLQEYEGRARRKRSEGKATWPGRKQVWRRYDAAGLMRGDVLTTADDAGAHSSSLGEPLLQAVMRSGRRLALRVPLRELRAHAQAELARLPERLSSLDPSPAYPVTVSAALHSLARQVDGRQRGA